MFDATLKNQAQNMIEKLVVLNEANKLFAVTRATCLENAISFTNCTFAIMSFLKILIFQLSLDSQISQGNFERSLDSHYICNKRLNKILLLLKIKKKTITILLSVAHLEHNK